MPIDVEVSDVKPKTQAASLVGVRAGIRAPVPGRVKVSTTVNFPSGPRTMSLRSRSTLFFRSLKTLVATSSVR